MKSEWRTEPLHDVVAYIAKGIPPAYVEAEGEKTVRVLNQKCNRNFAISYAESRLHDLSKRSVPEEKYLRDDDILINSTGTGTVGRIAQLSKVPCPTIVDGHMIVLRGNEKVTQRYLGYALKAQQDIILRLDEGSTGQTEMNRDRLLSEIEVSYPVSLSEQDAIAATLSAIDARIAENQKINHHLEQMVQTIFKSWFVDFEPFGGVIPDDWREGVIADTCSSIFNGGTPRRNEPTFWEGTIPWLTSGEVRQAIIVKPDSCISEAGLKGSSAKWVPSLSTVVALYGATAGQVSMVATPLTTNQAITALVPKESCTYYNYLVMQNAVSQLENNAIGSAQQNISKAIVEKTACLIPADTVLAEFDKLVSPFFNDWIQNLFESSHLAALRDTLLPRLMSGDLSVADVDAK